MNWPILMSSTASSRPVQVGLPTQPDPDFANVMIWSDPKRTNLRPVGVTWTEQGYTTGTELFGSQRYYSPRNTFTYTDQDVTFTLGTSDFTYEQFIRLPSGTNWQEYGGYCCFNVWGGNAGEQQFIAYYQISISRWVLELKSDSGSVETITFPNMGEPTEDTWHHVAFVRSGDFVAMYFNGVRNGPFIALPTGFTAQTATGRIRYNYTQKSNVSIRTKAFIALCRFSTEALYTAEGYLPRTENFPTS